MSSWRTAAVFAVGALLAARLTTCRGPGENGSQSSPEAEQNLNVQVRGIDTSALTARERSEWSRYVSELLAPCPEHPVSLAQCVNESRGCRACAPAAKLLVREVRRGRVRAQVEALFKARFSPSAVRPIDVQGAPLKGREGAPILIAEWADFECPACGSARPLLDEMLARYRGNIALVFKHFPLSMHPHAEKAARAAMAAHKQGKFWEMHAALFDHQEQLDPASVERLAQGVGLDLKRFVQDRDSEATADAVARDRKQGTALEIVSTPSIFINGRAFPSSTDFAADLVDWIDLELELLGLPVPAAAAAPAPPSAVAPAAASPPPPPAPAASR